MLTTQIYHETWLQKLAQAGGLAFKTRPAAFFLGACNGLLPVSPGKPHPTAGSELAQRPGSFSIASSFIHPKAPQVPFRFRLALPPRPAVTPLHATAHDSSSNSRYFPLLPASFAPPLNPPTPDAPTVQTTSAKRVHKTLTSNKLHLFTECKHKALEGAPTPPGDAMHSR